MAVPSLALYEVTLAELFMNKHLSIFKSPRSENTAPPLFEYWLILLSTNTHSVIVVSFWVLTAAPLPLPA